MPDPGGSETAERTVITFGTFDVFHVGHLKVIERAAALGDRLVVGVSADALNLRKKGREPVFSQVTPFLLLFWAEGDPFYSPFSVRLTGALRIEEAGRYFLDIQADDGARLLVDGKVVAEELTPLRANRPQVDLDLAAGEHPVQIDYFQVGGSNALEFYWRTPRGDYGPVPPQVLIPGRGAP